jgi:hypothetical protein
MNTATTFPVTLNNTLPSGNGVFHLSGDAGTVIIKPANSSAITEAHYLTNTQTLAITYKGGALYYYQQVPPFVVFNLMVAESFGKFVNEYIKPNYEFWKSN